MQKLLIGFLLLSAVAQGQTKRINFKAPLFYPEGTVYDEAGKRFFVGSVKTATIGTVSESGQFKTFFADSSLKSSYGMKIDRKEQKLWVCTGDPNYSDYSDSATYKKQIRLIALDLKTGKRVSDIDLSNVYQGKHFANDLAVDDDGTIYITDSYSPVVYRVTAAGKPEIFAQDPRFASVDIGLNGIALTKDAVLVVNNSDGQLFAINKQNPSLITPVKQPAFFPGADGLLWDKAGNLVLVQNKGSHKIYQLRSADNWQTCQLVAATSSEDRFLQPSTATLMGITVYVVNSKLNELSDPTAKPSMEFSLQEAVFRPVK